MSDHIQASVLIKISPDVDGWGSKQEFTDASQNYIDGLCNEDNDTTSKGYINFGATLLDQASSSVTGEGEALN